MKGGEVRPGAVPLGGAQVCRHQGSWQSGLQGVVLAPPSLESPLPPSWDWSLGTTPRQVTGGLGGVARYGLQLGDRDREPPPAVVLVPRGCSEPHLPFLQHQGPIPPLGLGWRHGGVGDSRPGAPELWAAQVFLCSSPEGTSSALLSRHGVAGRLVCLVPQLHGWGAQSGLT